MSKNTQNIKEKTYQHVEKVFINTDNMESHKKKDTKKKKEKESVKKAPKATETDKPKRKYTKKETEIQKKRRIHLEHKAAMLEREEKQEYVLRFKKDNKAAEKWTKNEALRLAYGLLDWMLEDDANIFKNDYLYLKKHEFWGQINPDTLEYLCKKFPEFFDAMKKSKQIQQAKLLKFGVLDKLNPYLTKFTLNVVHGMVERKEVTQQIEQKGIISINPITVSSEDEDEDEDERDIKQLEVINAKRLH